MDILLGDQSLLLLSPSVVPTSTPLGTVSLGLVSGLYDPNLSLFSALLSAFQGTIAESLSLASSSLLPPRCDHEAFSLFPLLAGSTGRWVFSPVLCPGVTDASQLLFSSRRSSSRGFVRDPRVQVARCPAGIYIAGLRG